MTPLASKVARDLTLPIRQRKFDDRANVADLFDKEIHCFEVSPLAKSVNAVMDGALGEGGADEAWSVWRDIGSMLPGTFLPSPVTWLEMVHGNSRVAIVLQQRNGRFVMDTVHDSQRGPFSLRICEFRPRSLLEAGDRVEVIGVDEGDASRHSIPAYMRPSVTGCSSIAGACAAMALLLQEAEEAQRDLEAVEAKHGVLQMANRFIGLAVLTLDLINTPGLVGLKQRDINRGLARKLAAVGRYPSMAWSEVVLKHETRFAAPGERLTGTTHHKCLHFVRSHLRHYRDGKVTVIPAHWRGDAAIGIKRTRYSVAA